MRNLLFIPLMASIALLPGCLAKTAADLVTAPVRAASKAVDLATTSQSESDEKRGRALRKQEEELGKLERRYSNQRGKCMAGDANACTDALQTNQKIQTALGNMPQAQKR